jgi:NAD(P)H-dependent FMN reductase
MKYAVFTIALLFTNFVSADIVAYSPTKQLRESGYERYILIKGNSLASPIQKLKDHVLLRALVHVLSEADGIVIASPEYAHGVSGVIKNALDWLVSGIEFPYKPIMLINTSPRASHAQASLREILSTMSGVISEKACISLPLLSSDLDEAGILENKDMSDALAASLNEFCVEIEQQRLNSPVN